ncbi:cytochrome P450 [Amycolatopsis rhabdoformis]|uniref:Cytochrome P450 n=1 Tax=Amycolatopsis rhabdoformis TaxID=1448059 RepID=A0ABZ1I9D4_9PSEU|nr:cytochrome P450 [Amycolatopsis rhabdoformis]WSE31066.1 cytochrome P450 [Amycolatopsis rhabdoformis]
MSTALPEAWSLHKGQFWLRGERPAAEVEYKPELGTWNVYGHPEAHAILSDPATFSSDVSRLLPEKTLGDTKELSAGNLLQLDPPLHNKMRKLVSRAFTPKVVADLEPRIAELTHELLDEAGGRDHLELVADLAYPLPVIVIAELLGVPASDRDLFRQWVDRMLESPEQFSFTDDSEEQQQRVQAQLATSREFTEYLGEHAEDRRRHPREDLLTKLVEAEVDGERLTRAEIVNFAQVLLIAGHITTTMLLGNTVLCLDTFPEWDTRVRADRELLVPAIEESLRFLSPFGAVARVTNREVEVGGATIPADRMLMIWIAAANRDPRAFAEPDTFDPTREDITHAHLAFGRGIHFCIGAPLARLEGRTALNILLDRYPSLRTIPGKPPTFQPNPAMTGVTTLPLSG